MYEIWTKQFGVIATRPDFPRAVKLLKEYAHEAGASVDITFNTASFRDDEGRRYVARKVA